MIANSKIFSSLFNACLPKSSIFCASITKLHHHYTKAHISTSKVLLMHVHFDLHPAKNSYKTLFHRTQLGMTLKMMSAGKSLSEGLKIIECNRGIRSKWSPI